MELNIEQRLWFAWLYANTYNLATAWIIANEFPDYENVNIETLTKWNTANYKRLRYQVDNKWQKGHLPTMFASYKKCIGAGSQQQCFNKLLGATEQESFTNIYNFVVKRFYKFGRYLTWFYLQFLKATCDLPVTPISLLLRDDSSRSHCKGLLYVLNLEALATDKKFKLTASQYQLLDTEAEKLLLEMLEYDDVSADYFSMETCLCAFKKIFRAEHGRYLGYYLDRQAEDISRCQHDNWPGIAWQLLWQGRTENINNELLNAAVDKTKFGELIKYGKVSKINEYV